MFFHALATDYDGTIATDGSTPASVVDALKHFKATGRKLILVTGREVPDLKTAFPDHGLFDRIVAENGAVVYDPNTRHQRALGPKAPDNFIAALRGRNVQPLSVGEVIVATWEPNEQIVLDTIKQLGLELQIIFNKGAVMVLPPGVNKASGLKAALDDLALSPINTVAVGDAENDHAFLAICGCSAAVANALASVKERCDIILRHPRGAGVEDLLERIGREDGGIVPPERHGIVLGHAASGEEVSLPSLAGNVLIAGHSAVGKSTIATALTERMAEKGLQFAILDPEGDFEKLENATQLGSASQPPSLEEAANMLRKLDNNLVVNALAVPLEDRPKFFTDLLGLIVKMRLELSRPHWLIVDEAHHVLPTAREGIGQSLPHDLFGTIFITVHPDSIATSVLDKVQVVIAAGPDAQVEIETFCKQIDCPAPIHCPQCGDHDVLLWDRRGSAPTCLTPTSPAQIHRRHTRKYAQGELGPDKSFYFRGPDSKLNLRARNLISFLDIGDGVDDETWSFHRRGLDYSSWILDAIKDDDLAKAVQDIETSDAADAEARSRIREAIEQRYTAPAIPPS